MTLERAKLAFSFTLAGRKGSESHSMILNTFERFVDSSTVVYNVMAVVIFQNVLVGNKLLNIPQDLTVLNVHGQRQQGRGTLDFPRV